MDYRSFILQNPWRAGGQQIQVAPVKRSIFAEIMDDISRPEITILTGSRQVGKTTLLKAAISELLDNNVSPKAIFYFNLDDSNLFSYFDQYAAFIDFIQSEYKGHAYIFIDEIQRLESPGLFLKLIYDLDLKMKIVVSGSSSLELKAKTVEHLTGRKHVYELFPFSFEEYLRFHGKTYYFSRSIESLRHYHHEELNSLLHNFILYGGYPKPILAHTRAEKTVELKDIYDSYVQKDVKDYLKIENINGYNKLVNALALQVGNLINYNELSLVAGLNIATVRKYLDCLEGTYVFKRISPWFSNARKEISKAPKVYGYDTGLMNYITQNQDDDLHLKGNVQENFVCSELMKKGKDVSFWRNSSGAEVDFVVNTIPIEIKATALKKPTLSKSFFSYCRKYQPEYGLLFNQVLFAQREIDPNIVHFFPLWAVPKVIDQLMA